MTDWQHINKADVREVPAPVPLPPGHMQTHFRQSALAVAGCYVLLGILALVHAEIGGKFAVPPDILALAVVLSPVLTVAAKDYIHWMSTGEWIPPSV